MDGTSIRSGTELPKPTLADYVQHASVKSSLPNGDVCVVNKEVSSIPNSESLTESPSVMHGEVKHAIITQTDDNEFSSEPNADQHVTFNMEHAYNPINTNTQVLSPHISPSSSSNQNSYTDGATSKAGCQSVSLSMDDDGYSPIRNHEPAKYDSELNNDNVTPATFEKLSALKNIENNWSENTVHSSSELSPGTLSKVRSIVDAKVAPIISEKIDTNSNLFLNFDFHSKPNRVMSGLPDSLDPVENEANDTTGHPNRVFGLPDNLDPIPNEVFNSGPKGSKGQESPCVGDVIGLKPNDINDSSGVKKPTANLFEHQQIKPSAVAQHVPNAWMGLNPLLAKSWTSTQVSSMFNYELKNNLQFDDNMPEHDPLRGSHWWNKELFSQLTKGVTVENSETRLLYDPPKLDENGEPIIEINAHFMKKSIESHVVQLYGYFVGGNPLFQVVRQNLIRMWHKFGFKSMFKNRNGFYFFRFDTEEGMLNVLKTSPWVVDNVHLMLNLWKPDSHLTKPNPKMLPIWVGIKDLPNGLWNGGNICQIVSKVGKPIMLDKATHERCKTKKGPSDLARVLVDAMAENGLPTTAKVRIPKTEFAPSEIINLELCYKWKPELCNKCLVFGHQCEKYPNPIIRETTIFGKQGNENTPIDLDMHAGPRVWVKPMGLANTETHSGPIGVDIQETPSGPKETRKGGLIYGDKLQQIQPGEVLIGPGPDGFTVVQKKKKKNNKPRKNGPNEKQKNGPKSMMFKVGNSKQAPIQAPIWRPKRSDGASTSTAARVVDLKRKKHIKVSNQFSALDFINAIDHTNDVYDDEYGVWESDKKEPKKYFDMKKFPPKDIWKKWSKGEQYYWNILRSVEGDRDSAYEGYVRGESESDEDDYETYDENEKQNEEDEQDVESETDGMARFMKPGSLKEKI